MKKKKKIGRWKIVEQTGNPNVYNIVRTNPYSPVTGFDGICYVREKEPAQWLMRALNAYHKPLPSRYGVCRNLPK